MMLRQQLQRYIERVYPNSKFGNESSLSGLINIRFDIGEELENGSLLRVTHATNRALTIFNDTFDNPQNEIWILIYEYPPPNIFNASNSYLNDQFPAEKFKNFYNELESNEVENERASSEKEAVRIIIGKLPVDEINIKNILTGIANTEMGFDPAIDQAVYFVDPLTDKAFHMYDDRGCDVFSDNADKIRDVYTKRKEWILEYDKHQIDKYFNQHERA